MKMINKFIATTALVSVIVATANAGTFTVIPFTGDGDSGISVTKSYTHALDFAQDGAGAVINGVAFTPAGLVGPGWTVTASAVLNSNFSNQFLPGPDPGMFTLMDDFFFGTVGGSESIELTGLTPGSAYDLRIYNQAFGAGSNDSGRDQLVVSSLGDTLAVYQQDSTPPTILEYSYVAPGSGSIKLTFTPLDGGTLHIYGLTNQSIPEPSTLMLIGLGICGLIGARRMANK